MKPSKVLFLMGIGICFLCCSCVGGKYRYQFDTGKSVDFGSGKWLLNDSKSNATPRYDQRLYNQTYKGFEAILGDSLMSLTILRSKALVAPEIKLEPSQKELKQLYMDSGCNYLINVRGEILSDGAGSISFNDPNSSYSTSNSASVSIKIYDLENGILISSSRATGIDTEENSELEKDGALQFQTRAGPIMLQATERLINKYRKFRADR